MSDYTQRVDYLRALVIEQRIANGEPVTRDERTHLAYLKATGDMTLMRERHDLLGDEWLCRPLDPVYGPVEFAKIKAEFLARSERQSARNPRSHSRRQRSRDDEAVDRLDQGRGQHDSVDLGFSGRLRHRPLRQSLTD